MGPPADLPATNPHVPLEARSLRVYPCVAASVDQLCPDPIDLVKPRERARKELKSFTQKIGMAESPLIEAMKAIKGCLACYTPHGGDDVRHDVTSHLQHYEIYFRVNSYGQKVVGAPHVGSDALIPQEPTGQCREVENVMSEGIGKLFQMSGLISAVGEGI